MVTKSQAAKARWAKIPQLKRHKLMSDLATHRHAQLTPEQRSANAKRAYQARKKLK